MSYNPPPGRPAKVFKRQNCAFRRKKQPIQRKRATIVENELHICIRKRDETFKYPEKAKQYPIEKIKQYPTEETKQYPTEKTKQYPLEKTKQYPLEKTKQYPLEKTKHSRKGTKENKRSIQRKRTSTFEMCKLK